MFENSVDIAGKVQRSFATGAQSTNPLEPGVYDVWAGSADIYIKLHKTLASDVTSATGYLIKFGNVVPVRVVEAMYLGAAGSGNVYFHKVG